MDRLAKMDQAELVRRMRQEFEQTMLKVAAAVNQARDGHLIDDSEEPVRDLMGEFRRRVFEMAAQMRVEATEASADFSPGEPAAGASRRGGEVDAQLQRPGGVASPSLSKRRRPHDRIAGGRSDRRCPDGLLPGSP
jgi:hypothetical protein